MKKNTYFKLIIIFTILFLISLVPATISIGPTQYLDVLKDAALERANYAHINTLRIIAKLENIGISFSLYMSAVVLTFAHKYLRSNNSVQVE